MGEVWVFLVFSPYFCADTAASAFSFMILVHTGYPLSFFCSCMVVSVAISFYDCLSSSKAEGTFYLYFTLLSHRQ